MGRRQPSTFEFVQIKQDNNGRIMQCQVKLIQVHLRSIIDGIAANASTEEELLCNYWLMLPDIAFPFPLKQDEKCGRASCLLSDIHPVRACLGRFQVGVIYH